MKSKYSQRSEDERVAERDAYYDRKARNQARGFAKKMLNQRIWKDHPTINTLKKFARANG